MSSKKLGELEILECFRKELGLTRPHRLNLAGNTDDAAILPLLPDMFALFPSQRRSEAALRADSLVLTQDAMIEGVHFRLDYSTPEQVVGKCMAINLSDLAAMGGAPLGALVHVGLPKKYAVNSFLSSLTKGLRGSMRRHKYTIFGGDLTAARDFTVSAALIGRIDHKTVMLRRGAKAGDVLCISGTLGLASLGLKLLEGHRKGKVSNATLKRHPQAVKRLLEPRPRLKLGQRLAETGLVTSCIDLSDSLGRSLMLLAKESKVGFEVSLTPKLLHQEVRRYYGRPSPDELAKAVFSAEEDLELLFTVSAANPDEARGILPLGVMPIGTAVAPKTGIHAFHAGKQIPIVDAGFEHFG